MHPANPPEAQQGLTVFIVDDDIGFARGLARVVEASGWKPHVFDDPAAFLAHAQASSGSDACAVLDVYMPAMTGADLYLALRQRAVDLPVVFLSGHRDARTALSSLGDVPFLEKPVIAEELLAAIREATSRRRAA